MVVEEEKDSAQAIEDLSFNEASQELEAVIRRLEDNTLELEESLELYERGIKLFKMLRMRLTQAEQKVTALLDEIEPEDDSVDTTLS